MFGIMKKAMVVAAVAGVAAAAPAVASADVWSTDGTTAFAGAADLTGTLKTTLALNGVETECDVEATLDLTNPGGVAHGVVTTFDMDNCTTTAPNCTVEAEADAVPWTIDTSGTSVTITNVGFTNTYSGVDCSLNGAQVSADGTVTGSANGVDIEFDSAAGLTSPFGPLTLDGIVSATDAATGDPISLI